MTAVDLSLLADLLVGELERHCADPSPLRDASETDLIDMLVSRGGTSAEMYVARRVTHAIGRLREPSRSGDAVHDGLLVLGGFAHLQELRRKQVAA